MAENSGFSYVRIGLQAPNSLILGRQLPKVSGHVREYSRFEETFGGEEVRSALHGPSCSPFGRLLEPFVREIGNC